MMLKINYLPVIFLITFFLYSCGPSIETTVIQEDPRTFEDEPEESVEQVNEFHLFNIGFAEPVTNLDPLFAENTGTLATLSLIYESLFNLDPDGDPVPQLVNDFSISDDSLTYRFELRNDIYFQDSDIFSAGVGRKLNANDIQFIIQRSANATVPERAASLFMNIEGFEAYYMDQRKTYDPNKRTINNISGIEIQDSHNFTIKLEDPDPDFLKKLASPLASVYPREALQRSPHHLFTNPVGTGAYQLQRWSGENEIVLVRNTDHWKIEKTGERPRYNRIHVFHNPVSEQLFQQFTNGDIDWLPVLVPELADNLLDSAGNLLPAYQADYQLNKNRGSHHLIFRINDDAKAGTSALKQAISELPLPGEVYSLLQFNYRIEGFSETGETAQDLHEKYKFTYSDDPFIKHFMNRLSEVIFEPESQLQMANVRVPTSEIVLTGESANTYPAKQLNHYSGPYLTAEYSLYGISHSNVTGIQGNGIPWWFDVMNIRINNDQRAVQ